LIILVAVTNLGINMKMIIIISSLPRIIRKLAIIFPKGSREGPNMPDPRPAVVMAPIVSKYES
jgi:hypothetical protein